MLVDDYGHHPTEVDATIKAARAGWPDKRIVMVFQPHRYTRTRDLYDDFANTLDQVDILLMLDVYAAGEPVIRGGQPLAVPHNPPARQTGSDSGHRTGKIAAVLAQVLEDNDLILVQGAGNIGKIARTLADTKLRPVLSEDN